MVSRKRCTLVGDGLVEKENQDAIHPLLSTIHGLSFILQLIVSIRPSILLGAVSSNIQRMLAIINPAKQNPLDEVHGSKGIAFKLR